MTQEYEFNEEEKKTKNEVYQDYQIELLKVQINEAKVRAIMYMGISKLIDDLLEFEKESE